jgi:hypothetical protein
VTIPVTLSDHSIIFLDGAGRISSIDLRLCRATWSFHAPHSQWSRVPAVVIAGLGTVVGTSYGRLHLIDEEGEQRTATTVARRLTSGMGTLDSNTIAFETKGAVVAFRVEVA